MKNYIKLMRPKHYLKNVLIFIPLIFSGQFLEYHKLVSSILGFLSFCFLASAVYVINDIKDVEKDKQHPIKKERPIASGKISKLKAILFCIILLIVVVLLNIALLKLKISLNDLLIATSFEFIYFISNLAYSLGLKSIPIIDIVILGFGFVLRVLYGAQITGIEISNWLYLTIMSGSFYMGLGKRRNEAIKQGNKSRDVLKKYTKEFLDKFMYVCLVLAIVFYSLWCIDAQTIERIGNNYIIWTIPLLLVILMKYSLNIEGDSFGDPVDVILKDKILMLLSCAFGIMMIGILYVL